MEEKESNGTMNKKQMQKSGASEVEILRAELNAAFEIIEELPVDAHDMDVHFWCNDEEDDEITRL